MEHGWVPIGRRGAPGMTHSGSRASRRRFTPQRPPRTRQPPVVDGVALRLRLPAEQALYGGVMPIGVRTISFHPQPASQQPATQGRSKAALMANAGTMQGWHGPLARPAGLPARLSGAGRTVGNGLRMQTERLTRSVRRVAGRHGPVARATLVCNRLIMPLSSAPASNASTPLPPLPFAFRTLISSRV